MTGKTLLAEIKAIVEECGLSVETGVFSDVAPKRYVVVTPLAEPFELFADNAPEFEIQEARISLYDKGNYTEIKNKLVRLLLQADFTITEKRYIGHEDDTGYNHYSIDVEKYYDYQEV